LVNLFWLELDHLKILEMSSICVLNFLAKKDDWFTFSTKILSKAKRSRSEDAMLVKVKFPKTLNPIDEETEKGKRQLKAIGLNELAFH
jgi:hypothetical protein